MRTTQIHPRIVQHSFAPLMQGALLSSYDEKGHDLILDVQGLQITSSELFEREEKICERIEGEYVPLRLKFSNISKLHHTEFITSLENLVQEDPSRTIEDMLSWRQPKVSDVFHIIGLHDPLGGGIDFFAQKATCEARDDDHPSIIMERDWCPAPPMPDCLVPRPNYLYRRFGGDSITVQINKDVYRHRLFIGGLDIQSTERPKVDAVLNLGEEASRWVKGQSLCINDRTRSKGEGSNGMTIAEICEEANWVIEHLKNSQRVLVHCVAGMNRSTTICCAVLILQEGLSAESALQRVREHHPWARPDSRHWLTLRWLASNRF